MKAVPLGLRFHQIFLQKYLLEQVMPRLPIVNVGIDTTSYDDSCDRIVKLVHQQQAGYVIAANVHVVMTAYWHRQYRQVLDKAAIVTPDGMPLVWALRLFGIKDQQRVYGPDLMLALCDRAVYENLAIYLFGANDETLAKLERNLKQRFPNLAIAGKHAPPYFDLDAPDFALQLTADLELIRDSGAKLIFVALGCPKQEFWMHLAQDHAQEQLSAVMIGVGAAFDFHSGQVSQAPRWIMAIGLEWLYRFCQEPKRLWQRYLINNPLFVVLLTMQYLQKKIRKN